MAIPLLLHCDEKKPGLKQFPWIKTIFVFWDPDYKKYSIFQNELRTAEN